MSFKPVTHCIFDLDGTLVDSEHVYYNAIDSVAREFGKSHSLELCRKINGTTRADYSRIIVEHCELPITPDEFLERMDAKAHNMLEKIQLMPGVEKLVNHLSKHGIPMAIGTSSCLDSVALKLKNFQDLKACFSHIVSGSNDPDVKNGKPAPDVFLVTARRFNPSVESRNCLVFEDSMNGALAGLAAGMQTVLIPDPNIVTEEQKKIPTLCLASLEDFKPELFGLPPYNV